MRVAIDLLHPAHVHFFHREFKMQMNRCGLGLIRRSCVFRNGLWLGTTCLALVAVVGSCDSARKQCEPIKAQHEKPGSSSLGPGQSMSLFDGQTLDGWSVVKDTFFEEHGKVYAKDGAIILEEGRPMTAISWTGNLLRDEYEVTLEANRVEGGDFFCGMTFPVGDSPCTLILGGWGGSVVGLSNVDGMHAAENATTTTMDFRNGRWYRIRLRVTRVKIEAWIDDEKQIEQARADHRFTVWPEQEPVVPFGIATYYTKAALRNITLRRLTPEPPPESR